MNTPHIIFRLFAINYQSWWKFHEVMTKTILLGDTMYQVFT